MTEQFEHARKTWCLSQQCCEGPVDPVLLRRFFKQAILAHWEDPNNHGRYSDVLGCYSPISETGKGKLNVVLSYEDNLGEKIVDPRIVVGLKGSNILKKTLGNRNGVSDDGATIETAWQVDTNLVLTHIFQDADVALIAAQSTFEYLAGFHTAFMGCLGLSMMEPKQTTDPQIYPGTKHPQTYFQVDVTFALNYNFNISVNIESHRLKKVVADITIP